MKTAEKNIKNTNTGIVEKYTNNAIIRMSDFYPDTVGGQEYCMVSKEVYAELLRFKAIDEGEDTANVKPDNTPTVIISVRDFYPVRTRKDEYREISREEFDVLMDSQKEKEKIENFGIITVKAADFAPYIDSENEYVDIKWETYVALLKIKATEEYIITPDRDRSTSVKIRISDFFSDYRENPKFNYVSINIYDELLRMRAYAKPEHDAHTGKTVRIKISDFYPGHTGGQEYVEVSAEIYEFMLDERRRKKRDDMQDYRYLCGCAFDEIKMGEMNGKYEQSAEENIIDAELKKKLYDALALLPVSQRDRVIYKYIYGMTRSEIAEMENVSLNAVGQSIRAGLKLLRKIMTEMPDEEM